MDKISPNNIAQNYFLDAGNKAQNKYCALRAFFVGGMSAEEAAKAFGYTKSTIYSLARDFKAELAADPGKDPFFTPPKTGRKPLDGGLAEKVAALRKANMSVPEIKSSMDGLGMPVSTQYINSVLKREGFAKLPRRSQAAKSGTELPPGLEKMQAEKARAMDFSAGESFTSESLGLLAFLPVLAGYGIDKAIEESAYPQTKSMDRLRSILCFLALKLSSVKRYSMDDLWCMDRGMGMFAGLNVLPKAAWYSSYSSAVTRPMNLAFLRSLAAIWEENGLLGDTANLGFTSIPYWGDGDSLENNWSGKRGKALESMLAVLAQDSESGIICYGDTTVRHSNSNKAVLEFLDFQTPAGLKYLVFDSKMTTYQNLSELNKRGTMFVTIRRRSKSLLERINGIDKWKGAKIKRANGKHRNVKLFEESAQLKGYEGEVRQIYMTGHGKIKPAVIITNDFATAAAQIVQKYSRRWLVEKEISEHIEFFHLNRNSSGMVVKVDFDFTMTILAHNLYRLLAMHLPGSGHCEAETIYTRFVKNSGEAVVGPEEITIKLKKKRNLPLMLEFFGQRPCSCPWIGGKPIKFEALLTT